LSQNIVASLLFPNAARLSGSLMQGQGVIWWIPFP
jgi:hypothetical protein